MRVCTCATPQIATRRLEISTCVTSPAAEDLDFHPDMQRATGQSYPQLSQTVQRLSAQLLLQHPAGYARQVARGFVDFWKGYRLHPNWRPFGELTRLVWVLSRESESS